MFFDFFRPTIGIEFTTKSIRAARAKQNGSTIKLLEHGEELFPDEGPRTGKEADASATKSLALQKLLDSLHTSPKKVVLVIPSRQVYTHLFTFPVSAKNDLQKQIQGEVARSIPEEPGNLKLLSKILHQSHEKIDVGIAAARTDVLQEYTNACVAAHLRPIGVTTAPCMIAHILPEHPPSFTLIHATETSTTVTLFYNAWPIDEEVFPEGASMETVVQAAQSMMKEYQESGLAAERIFLFGSQMKKAVPPALVPGPASPGELSPPQVEEVLSAWREQAAWIAPVYASIVRVDDLSVNFAM